MILGRGRPCRPTRASPSLPDQTTRSSLRFLVNRTHPFPSAIIHPLRRNRRLPRTIRRGWGRKCQCPTRSIRSRRNRPIRCRHRPFRASRSSRRRQPHPRRCQLLNDDQPPERPTLGRSPASMTKVPRQVEGPDKLWQLSAVNGLHLLVLWQISRGFRDSLGTGPHVVVAFLIVEPKLVVHAWIFLLESFLETVDLSLEDAVVGLFRFHQVGSHD